MTIRNLEEDEQLVACDAYTDAALVWQAAGWHIFTHEDEDSNIGAVDCVHAATGKIIRFGLYNRAATPWPKEVLMTLIKMSEEKI